MSDFVLLAVRDKTIPFFPSYRNRMIQIIVHKQKTKYSIQSLVAHHSAKITENNRCFFFETQQMLTGAGLGLGPVGPWP
jgi:hypothetical protein